MRIMHVCLSCFYIDGFNYQENMLVREHVKAGHDVKVLASTENYVDGKLAYVEPAKYLGSDGAEVIRLPYRRFLPHKLMTKLRMHSAVYEHITEFSPDVLMFHGLCGWELRTVSRYKKSNPNVKLWVDSHEDFNNSARSFVSKNILHRLFYRPIFKKSIPYVEKVLCISLETMDFIGGFYNCPKDKIEYFPLGGFIFDDEEYKKNRISIREKYDISPDTLIFFQSGKFDAKKKLVESLEAFQKVSHLEKIQYLVAGVLQDDVKSDLETLLAKDDRIRFLGWKNAGELMQLLCAADVYVQPGSQSATLQNSICCRCAVIVDDVPSHYPFVKGNGWMINNSLSLSESFQCAIQAYNDGTLIAMNKKSLSIAKELLDYKKMAEYLVS